MHESLPLLPHLPAVEAWRESTQSAALHRSPRLQVLDDALEAYEASFRRYGVISQAYYRSLGDARYEETGLPLAAQRLAAGELAKSAYSRAAHDFEAVAVAFNAWINHGDASLEMPLANQMDDLLGTGRSQLDLQSAIAKLSQQSEAHLAQPSEVPATGIGARHTRGPMLSLKPNRRIR